MIRKSGYRFSDEIVRKTDKHWRETALEICARSPYKAVPSA
jgi:hypothetical protein